MMKKVYFITVLCFLVLFTTNAQTNNKTQSFSDLELKLNNNETVKITELKGKVVLFDFWHRGCFPCLKAIPDLIKLQEEFKDDLVIIGINDFDLQEDVTDYFEYKKVNYLSTYKTDDKIFRNLKIQAFPTTVLLDKQGNVIHTDTGYTKAGMRKLRQAIQKVLK